MIMVRAQYTIRFIPTGEPDRIFIKLRGCLDEIGFPPPHPIKSQRSLLFACRRAWRDEDIS
jgi:hypothetical protein